jgi:PAS domain S-box-containing protein
MRAEPEHRGILAVDIQGFGRLDRSNPDRAQMRVGLHRLLDGAMAAARIKPEHIEQTECGDGVLVLLDPQVSKARLLHPLLSRLANGLARYNDAVPRSARLRLRVVVHAGELLRDALGITGEDLVLAFRLLDANVVRACLTQTGADLVLVVSDVIYQGIVKHGYGAVDPASFQSVWVTTKETCARTWLHIPGSRREDIAAVSASGAAASSPTTLLAAHGPPALPGPTPPAYRVPGSTTIADEQPNDTWQISARAYVEDYHPGGSWVQFSPQGLSMFGYSTDENAAPNFWKTAVHPADRDRVLATDEWCDQTLEPWRMTYRTITGDGRAIWVRDESVVIHDEIGMPRCWLGMILHLADHTMAEPGAARRLEVVDELRATFLSAVSNEAQTPLTNILKICRTLEQRRTRLSENAASKLFTRVANNVGRLDRLLADVINLQRLGQGMLALNRRPFDVATLVERVAARWRGGDGWPQVSAPSATVWLDADKVERIIDELLASVTRRTPAGTPVWVRTCQIGTGILLAVEADGPDLPLRHRGSLLEQLSQWENGLLHGPSLTIGLSLVMHFAVLHGGTAWAEDRSGGGSSVSVLLPGPSHRG